MRCAMSIPGSWWLRVSVVALLSFAAQVFASDRPGAGSDAAAPVALRAPSEVAGVVSGLRLLGRGTMRFFGLSIYEARLWAGADFSPMRYDGHAFALELQYALKLDGAAIAQRSIVEMRRAGNLDDDQAKAWEAALARAFPDVAPGDRLTGVHVPGQQTRFFHNGRPTSAVADPAFARSFFGIWLAASTSEPGLRRQLIGPGS
jgi:Chalcone isomerase-like